METKINIAEILRNKLEGTKLYSPIFGNCTFCYIKDETNDICVKSLYGGIRFFNFEGLYNTGGECLLFPSKEMRDWSKFAWKRGDVLTNSSDFKIFFDKWVNEDYTKFLGKIKVLGDSHYYYYDTAHYTLASKEEALGFIKSVEKIDNGKLNPEISKIEKAQPKFKDGDILSCDEDSYTRHTTLIFHENEDTRESIASLIRHKKLIETNEPISDFLLSRLNYAREDEKKELFDALAKEGKSWDAEKKEVVDLKPKVGLKPFDKVLVRDYDNEIWHANLFSNYYMSKGFYGCVCSAYKQCIPYKGNEHLLGTTNDPK